MAQLKTVIQNQTRVLRFERGEMTQQELADLVGVSRQTINAIETAKYFQSLEVAFRISRVLGKPLDEVCLLELTEKSAQTTDSTHTDSRGCLATKIVAETTTPESRDPGVS